MSKRIRELQEKRAKLVADARAVLDTATKDNQRSLNDTEQASFDNLTAEADKLKAEIEREERLYKMELETRAKGDNLPGERELDPNPGKAADERRMESFRKFLRGGVSACTPEELREMQADNSAQGGYLMAPQQFVSQLLEKIHPRVFLRSKATVFTLTQAVSMGVPTLETDVSDPEWTAEIGEVSMGSGLTFGRRELHPRQLTKGEKISNMLLQFSQLPVESIVQNSIARKFGQAEENGYLNGSGVTGPLGMFTASADGINTDRDVVCGSATAPTFDGLIDLKHGLKEEYWPRAEWLFHRDANKILMKIKDNDGLYIWQPSVVAGQQDTLFGRPVNLSTYCPNTFTTGQYVALFADFSFYWIAEVNLVYVQRLVELYARTNQTGFIARRMLDGMPVLSEAFARGKLG